MTYSEICERILYEAQRGGQTQELANLNTQSVLESIMPGVLQEITLQYAKGDADKQSLLRETHTVTLTDGVGELPETVLTTCIWGSTVYIPDEPTIGPLMSYTPWASFIQPCDTRLGYYSIRSNHEFFWVDPGDEYEVGVGRTGDVEVTIATVLAIPDAVDVDTETGWPAEAESDIIDLASEWLRGAKIAA